MNSGLLFMVKLGGIRFGILTKRGEWGARGRGNFADVISILFVYEI